jgi:type I restriction enzyme S subunit
VLTEQKQAIITHAVTKGLNPSAPLKPSGIDWLGDVPEHWRVMAVKRVLRRLIDCEHKTAPAIDAGGAEEYRVVRTTAVRYGRLRLSGTYCTTAEAFAQWTERGLPEPGDVIFTREAPAGEACIVPSEHRVCLGQRTVLMKLRRDRYDPAFLVHMIYAGPPSHRIRIASQGSTVGHFNMDDIADMQVYVPPLAEQMALVAWIADHTKEIDLATAQAEREIDLIREYRTRLVADVVTGKVDVRAAAAALPDEPTTAAAGAEVQPSDDSDHGDVEDGAGDPENASAEEVEA